MSTPAVIAGVEKAKEFGSSSSSLSESQTTKVDVTISGAPEAAKGANGDYILHKDPLAGQTIPYYQGGQDDTGQMYITYDENSTRWEITSNRPTFSETKVGLVAYIACDLESAKKTYLASVSGKKEWFIKSSDSSKSDYKDPDMVADVKSGGESSTAAPAVTSSSVAIPAAAASVPASPPVVVTAPTESDMKQILKSTDTEYTNITSKLNTLSSMTVLADIQQFDKELDTAKINLKGAQDKLDAFRKAQVSPDHIILTSSTEPNDFSGGRSSSSSAKSKKNRKSYKSYHPGIGKTRKHHSNSEPKRVSFIHQA